MRRLSLVAACAALVSLTVPIARADAPTLEPYEPLQYGLAQIEGRAAWAHATGAVDPSDGEPVVVAVVDTGVDKDHPEFAGKLVGGVSWWNCPGATVPCADESAWDNGGHGTHVAGVIAAAVNGVGIAGVAPDARIMPVRAVGPDGPESLFAVGEGIRWAADHGADVINVSLGWIEGVHNVGSYVYGWAPAVQHALDKGVAVVMAAGNFFLPMCANEYGPLADAICVGATTRAGTRPFYSNWGAGVEVLAPGGDGTCADQIISTYPIDWDTQCPVAPGVRGYRYMAGTSMATPHVAGVAALLAEQGIRGRAAAERILATVDPVAGAEGLVHGRVNALRAVTGDLNPPLVSLP